MFAWLARRIQQEIELQKMREEERAEREKEIKHTQEAINYLVDKYSDYKGYVTPLLLKQMDEHYEAQLCYLHSKIEELENARNG